MNQKKLLLVAGSIGALLLIVIVLYFVLSDRRGPGGPGGGEDGPGSPLNFGNFEDAYPDAPDPATDPEIADQIRNLWPDVFKPRPDKDQVRREWMDFAKQYPNNIYIPDEFKAPLSDEDRKQRQETLEAVGGMESQIAAQRGQARSAIPGQPGPGAPPQPTVTPAEQKLYFNYKISELQSRIQLIDYMLKNSTVTDEQKANADKEMATWNKELAEYQSLLKKIP